MRRFASVMLDRGRERYCRHLLLALPNLVFLVVAHLQRRPSIFRNIAAISRYIMVDWECVHPTRSPDRQTPSLLNH